MEYCFGYKTYSVCVVLYCCAGLQWLLWLMVVHIRESERDLNETVGLEQHIWHGKPLFTVSKSRLVTLQTSAISQYVTVL